MHRQRFALKFALTVATHENYQRRQQRNDQGKWRKMSGSDRGAQPFDVEKVQIRRINQNAVTDNKMQNGGRHRQSPLIEE
jgi:cytochrome c556